MTTSLPDDNMVLFKGTLGTGAPLLGVVVSLSQVEAWLRITSLVIGCAVGIASFISIVRKRKKKNDTD
jgi:hypothetical protein